MAWNFRLQQGYGLFATDLAQIAQRKAGALPLLHGRRALQVGQSEVAFAVAAVCGTEQGEERGVLRDG